MVTRYCFVDWRPSPGGAGKEPDLPAGVPFLVMASPGQDAPWSIVRCDLAEDPPEKVVPVSPELRHLLASGERYPPALALARDSVVSRTGDRAVSKRELERIYSEEIALNLTRQRQAPCLLAEALVDQVGYLTAGEYYWVLSSETGPHGNTVRWVSDDFHVYQDAADAFALGPEELLRLRR